MSRHAAPEGDSRAPVGETQTAGPAGADGILAETERWRRQALLQRHLHDGASLRISALVPRLGVLRNRLRDDDPALQSSIAALQDQLHAVLQELREVARDIYPPLLDEAGLAPALRELADRVPVPVCVVAPEERYGIAVEGAVYFGLADCVAELAPGDPPVTVTLRREDHELSVQVEGFRGAAAPGMLDRVRPLGGRVTPRGTSTIEMSIPCA